MKITLGKSAFVGLVVGLLAVACFAMARHFSKPSEDTAVKTLRTEFVTQKEKLAHEVEQAGY